MADFSDEFGPFGETIWLNCAHQGPLPRVAAQAAREAIEWKRSPARLTSDRFQHVPERLRRALARLLQARAGDVVLANSASYGLHLLANGLPWSRGDEVLLVRGDFPSVVLPWLGLERRGVKVRMLDPGAGGLRAADLERGIRGKTRLLCTTWVHSFTGRAVDASAIGDVCRAHGVRFVLNAAQAVGARSLDVSSTPVDAVVGVGFKWLCGPYGTGYLWMTPSLAAELELNQAYWLAMQSADDLGREEELPAIREDLGAKRYDVFGTANFFSFVPWTASIELLLSKGIDVVAAHDDRLVDDLVAGLDARGFEVRSPRRGPERSTLVIASHADRSRNEALQRSLTEQNVFVSYRRGDLRFSPHLYNTPADVERALAALDRAAAR